MVVVEVFTLRNIWIKFSFGAFSVQFNCTLIDSSWSTLDLTLMTRNWGKKNNWLWQTIYPTCQKKESVLEIYTLCVRGIILITLWREMCDPMPNMSISQLFWFWCKSFCRPILVQMNDNLISDKLSVTNVCYRQWSLTLYTPTPLNNLVIGLTATRPIGR